MKRSSQVRAKDIKSVKRRRLPSPKMKNRLSPYGHQPAELITSGVLGAEEPLFQVAGQAHPPS